MRSWAWGGRRWASFPCCTWPTVYVGHGVEHPSPGCIERQSSLSPIHLRPAAPLAERVLLPGDPAGALLLGPALLLEEPLMFKHHVWLWGYTGQAADGRPLTIQSTEWAGRARRS